MDNVLNLIENNPNVKVIFSDFFDVIGKIFTRRFQLNLMSDAYNAGVTIGDFCPVNQVSVLLATEVAVNILEAQRQNVTMRLDEVGQDKCLKLVCRDELSCGYRLAGEGQNTI